MFIDFWFKGVGVGWWLLLTGCLAAWFAWFGIFRVNRRWQSGVVFAVVFGFFIWLGLMFFLGANFDRYGGMPPWLDFAEWWKWLLVVFSGSLLTISVLGRWFVLWLDLDGGEGQNKGGGFGDVFWRRLLFREQSCPGCGGTLAADCFSLVGADGKVQWSLVCSHCDEALRFRLALWGVVVFVLASVLSDLLLEKFTFVAVNLVGLFVIRYALFLRLAAVAKVDFIGRLFTLSFLCPRCDARSAYGDFEFKALARKRPHWWQFSSSGAAGECMACGVRVFIDISVRGFWWMFLVVAMMCGCIWLGLIYWGGIAFFGIVASLGLIAWLYKRHAYLRVDDEW